MTAASNANTANESIFSFFLRCGEMMGAAGESTGANIAIVINPVRIPMVDMTSINVAPNRTRNTAVRAIAGYMVMVIAAQRQGELE